MERTTMNEKAQTVVKEVNISSDSLLRSEHGILGVLLPRRINPKAADEAATIVHALLTHAHLDRREAREHGWRGVRPSFTRVPSWTARIAGCDCIYGLAFNGEQVHEGELLLADFTLYVFPDPDDPKLSRRCAGQRCAVQSPDWPERIRSLSDNLEELADYACAQIELGASLDGSGVEVTLTAAREATADGGFTRPLADSLPFFASFVQTISSAVGDEFQKELVLWAEPSDVHESIDVSVTFAAGSFFGRLPGRRMKKLYFAHRPHEDEKTRKPVVHVLSGFLGAGKTTFLQQWLEYLNNRERFTGVIQNEFGEVDLDTLILRGQTRVEALDEGCVCCTLADSLRPGIERLISATPADQIILETTGLARASAVMDSVLVLNDLVSRGLLITVVDAWDAVKRPEILDFDKPLDDEARCRRDQVENADVLICSKADAVSDDELEQLQRRLSRLNPDALVVAADHGSIPFGVLDAFFLHALDKRGGRLPSRDGTEVTRSEAAASRRFKGWGLAASREPSAEESFEQFAAFVPEERSVEEWRSLLNEAGDGLIRAKGIVGLAGHGSALLQYAAGILDFQPIPDGEAAAEAAADPKKRFVVFIGQGLKRPEGLEFKNGVRRTIQNPGG